jgi:hypothetical protein
MEVRNLDIWQYPSLFAEIFSVKDVSSKKYESLMWLLKSLRGTLTPLDLMEFSLVLLFVLVG